MNLSTTVIVHPGDADPTARTITLEQREWLTVSSGDHHLSICGDADDVRAWLAAASHAAALVDTPESKAAVAAQLDAALADTGAS